MDDPFLNARYSSLKWNAPLSQSHADLLLDALCLTSDLKIVDLGCGWGELLLQACERSKASGVGVDIDDILIQRARTAARNRHLDVSFLNLASDQWDQHTDRAICVGSSHTLKGSRKMLERLAEIVPRGKILVGDACWESTPTSTAREMFEEVISLADLVKLCREAGWQVLHISTADQHEWDMFESRHRAGYREWILANPNDPRVKKVEEEQADKEQAYLTKYRGILGFAYLVLGR